MVRSVDMKVFELSTCLTALCTYELMVDDTVDGEDNMAEKTREVDYIIRMFHVC